MSAERFFLTMRVVPDGDCWSALAVDVPGFAGGVTTDTLQELHAEVDAIKHFVLDVPKSAEVIVAYIYEIPGVNVEILDSYRHLRQQREEIAEKLQATAISAVAALRGAGVSVRDSAALLGISRSRVDQLSG
jgi:hypothetical protein